MEDRDGNVEALRERMRDAAAEEYATGALTEEEFEGVIDRIALVESERDAGRLGLVRFALADARSAGGEPGPAGAAARPAGGDPARAPGAARSEFTLIGSSRHVLMPGDSAISATILLGDVKVDCCACDSPRVDVEVVCILGDVIVEVPADAVVVNEMTTILGEYRDRSFDPAYIDPGRVVRITGFHLIGDVKVKRR